MYNANHGKILYSTRALSQLQPRTTVCSKSLKGLFYVLESCQKKYPRESAYQMQRRQWIWGNLQLRLLFCWKDSNSSLWTCCTPLSSITATSSPARIKDYTKAKCWLNQGGLSNFRQKCRMKVLNCMQTRQIFARQIYMFIFNQRHGCCKWLHCWRIQI